MSSERADVTDDVLDAARAGDSVAFTALWRALSPQVLGYLRARGVEDAEGSTSEVFLTVFRRLAGLQGGVAGLRTFVFSVAHARAVDDMRRRARRPAGVQFDPSRHDEPAPSAEHEALGRMLTAQVGDVLDALAADHREVLALRVVADLSLEQTAQIMGRSVGSIKQLQRRALLTLRQAVTGNTSVTSDSPRTIADRS